MMLTINEARRKGIDACIDMLSRDFVEKYKDTSTASWGMLPGAVRCFVGVDTRKRSGKLLVLDSVSKWYKCAECKVKLSTGEIYDEEIWHEGKATQHPETPNKMPEDKV